MINQVLKTTECKTSIWFGLTQLARPDPLELSAERSARTLCPRDVKFNMSQLFSSSAALLFQTEGSYCTSLNNTTTQ